LQDLATASEIQFRLDRMNTFGDEVYMDPKVLRVVGLIYARNILLEEWHWKIQP